MRSFARVAASAAFSGMPSSPIQVRKNDVGRRRQAENLKIAHADTPSGERAGMSFECRYSAR
jgi:hypothetical protein